MKQKVLITGRIPRQWLDGLEDLAEVTIWNGQKEFLMPRSELLAEIGNYTAIINFAEVKVDHEFIRYARQLRIIVNASIGFDNLDLPLLSQQKIWASNTPGYFNYPVAEYVFAGILVISRRLLEADHFVREGGWHKFEPCRWDGVSLKDKTLGIIGLGSIGKCLKRMAEAMGTKVIHYSASKRSEEGWCPLEELITTADILSVHIPLNPATTGLLSRKIIQQMKPGAIVVNTSRGAIIDQAALIEALRSGHIGGAVLDVFEDEPQVPDELKCMSNVLLTPHVAGGTLASREACMKRAIKNVELVLKGGKPINALNEIECEA